PSPSDRLTPNDRDPSIVARWEGAAESARTGSDQLDPIVVRVADKAEPGGALADLIRRPFGLDALLREARARLVGVLDAGGDVPVGGAQLVRAPVVVEGQLEHAIVVAHREEVVRRLALPVTDDVEVPREGEAERLVERTALLRIRDPDHGVQESGHGWILDGRLQGSWEA